MNACTERQAGREPGGTGGPPGEDGSLLGLRCAAVDEAAEGGDDVVHPVQRARIDLFDVAHGLRDLYAGEHLPGGPQGRLISLPLMPAQISSPFRGIEGDAMHGPAKLPSEI